MKAKVLSIQLIACCMVLFCSPFIWADVEEGIVAIEKGDYMAAYKVFKSLAEEGDIEAQHNLAILYKTGKGVMKDSTKAIQWFRKAADKGLADAQFNLGRMYDKGDGADQSFDYAALWYEKAAKRGHALAQTNLGVLYANGDGVPQDLIQAYVWFNLAAAQGVGIALENRETLSEHMTEEMRGRVKEISRVYFQRYVAPFHVSGTPGMMRSGNRQHRHQGLHQKPEPHLHKDEHQHEHQQEYQHQIYQHKNPNTRIE